MNQVTLMDHLRYRFDNYMAKGTKALIGGLTVLSFVVIIVGAALITVVDARPEGTEQPLSFLEAAWVSLMRTLDAGTMGGDTGWAFRLVMLGVTIGGVFIISALIGVLTSGVESKMEELRQGRSRVIENGHTVILGWSSQIFSVISELVIANANQAKPCIVILGNKDKVEMESEILETVGDTGRTRIVCRTGSPINLYDLEIVSLQAARSIIILSPEDEDPDAEVIKTILAITNNPKRRPTPYHIVAEIRDDKNFDVARMVGKDEVELILVGNLISRVIAQTCRQSGLSVVYTELMDFGGDEIYFKDEPALVGKPFREALLSYEDSAVIGLYIPGQGSALNPPMDKIIEKGEQIIAISEDDDTIRLSGLTDLGIQKDAMNILPARTSNPERTLLLGWNWRAPSVIQELDHYVSPGSSATIVADIEEESIESSCDCQNLPNLQVTFVKGDTTDRRMLDSLEVHTFDHVIVLSYSDQLEPQKADSRTLVTLLHLRDMAERGGYDISVVSEMLDLRNRELAEVTRADDFIVSDRLISLMLSQVSENKHLNAVFIDIFDPEGSEIYLKPVSDFVKLGVPVNFYSVVESAQRQAQVAFGYRLKELENDASQAYGITINPEKSKQVTFSDKDRIIVLAEY